MGVEAGIVISEAFGVSMATRANKNNLENSVFSTLRKTMSLTFLLELYKASNQQVCGIPLFH